MIESTFEMKTINDLFILLIDLDQGKAVTKDAPNVIEYLANNIQGGIGSRKMYYQDTTGRIDQLKVKDGRFDGFAPCSESQQKTILEMEV